VKPIPESEPRASEASNESTSCAGLDKDPTFRSDGELIGAWLDSKTSLHTKRNYLREATALLDNIEAGKGLRGCSAADLQAYIERLKRRAAPGSVQTAQAIISSLFGFAAATGYILGRNPAVLLASVRSKDTLPGRILSEEEMEKILTASARTVSGVELGNPRDAVRNDAMIRFLYFSALRVSELTNLRWRDVRPAPGGEGAFVTVFGKGGKTRTFRIPEDAYQIIARIRDGAQDADHVFRSSRTPHQKLCEVQILRIVRAAARRAGIFRGVSPHWFRHAFATHVAESGCSLHELQAYLGHEDLATTGRYLHARPKDATARFLRVGRLLPNSCDQA